MGAITSLGWVEEKVRLVFVAYSQVSCFLTLINFAFDYFTPIGNFGEKEFATVLFGKKISGTQHSTCKKIAKITKESKICFPMYFCCFLFFVRVLWLRVVEQVDLQVSHIKQAKKGERQRIQLQKIGKTCFPTIKYIHKNSLVLGDNYKLVLK